MRFGPMGAAKPNLLKGLPVSVKNSRCKLTPPQLASRWGVSCDKILNWIRSGELPAFNAALTRSGRPRWLIDITDIATFEQRRAAVSSARATRRRRPRNITNYF
jgi:hypothetical protein